MPTLTLFLAPIAASLAAFGLTTFSSDEAVLRDVLRISGRLSFLMFCPVLLATPLHRLAPGTATAWLKRRRRSFGVAFAGLHAFHAVVILQLLTATGYRPPLFVVLGGGTGFFFITAMFITSFHRPAKTLGARRWRLLHRVGLHSIASVFAYDFLVRAATYGARGEDVVAYVPFGAALVGAYVLRGVVAWRDVRPASVAPRGPERQILGVG